MKVLIAFDVAKQAFGNGCANAGQETGEGGGHHATEGAKVDSQHDQRDGNVEDDLLKRRQLSLRWLAHHPRTGSRRR